MTIEEKIRTLDLSLFDGKGINCQIHNDDKRTLLTVQNAIRNQVEAYTYLEIGSHMGGSIQPHLIDPKCECIYSIDLRPASQPDDREKAYIAYYENNSTARMLDLLSNIDKASVVKIKCFDSDASNVNIMEIEKKPQIVFIDGEHTKRAVISDFNFCMQVIADNGVILFHDAGIVYPGIQAIMRSLKKNGKKFVPALLDGFIFMIAFDKQAIELYPPLNEMYLRNYKFLKLLPIKKYFPRFLIKFGRHLQRSRFRIANLN